MSEVQEKPGGIRSENCQAITPHLVCAGAADAIDFYKKAFGAEEVMRLASPNGKLMHAAIKIGNASVMLVDELPEWGSSSPLTLGGSPVTLHLYVADVDAFVARAVKAGAILRMPVEDMFWGDRYGIIEDPFGHKWSVATHLRDMSGDEIEEAMKKFMPPRGSAS
ncbi:VOC family protein [Hyphomicrobium sp.]|uniref:VOC family protein n=1 Tax=Hyphomicrobium sp. TaxID=82 RepID=UPI0035640935